MMRWLILLLGLATTTALPAQVAELCGNGIDDDGDGLIDCEDDDCTFPLFSNYALGNSDSFDVSLGDLDGDGDLDAWVANSGANRVWINQGGVQGGVAGAFADSSQAVGNSNSYGVSLGDLDGDGDLDAWVANNNGQANRVWINQGGDQGGVAGDFADSGQALGNSYSFGVSLGDFDGDGDLDAWVTNQNQPNRVWINQGGQQGGVAGDFADSGQALGNSNSFGVSLGDLDGDGDLDAWVTNDSGQANRVWINQGGDQGGEAGDFLDSGQTLGNSDSFDVSLGDLDGDGDLDAWVTNQNQPNRVWINQGSLQGGVAGDFTDSGQALGNSFSDGVSLGDLDGDGDLDAWVTNDAGQANRVWINQGGVQGGTAGNFTDSGQALGNSYSRAIALGDLDGDGDLDAWVANRFQANLVWINGGFGNFSVSGQALGNSMSTAVSLGDLDGDGDLDAWVANGDGEPNRIWLNDGLGNFTDSGQALGNSDSEGVSLGDLDGDGDLDAWVANYGGQPNRIFVNDGLGNFADSGQELGNSLSWSVSLGDLDGDGDLDAWVANGSSQANRVWINQGGQQGGVAGNFLDSGQLLGNSESRGVSLGDLDGDGDLDAWVANEFNAMNQANHVWINQGGDQGGAAGNFADSGQELGNSFSYGVSLGDLDGDGDLDAWVVNVSLANRVWINQGGLQGGVASNFADSGQLLGNSESLDVSLGDLDGDGDLDAWVANYSQPDHVFMNLSLCKVIFRRGDANGDGAMDLADGITILGYLFGTSIIDCFDAADANDDGSLNIADAIATLSALFSGGPNPPTPGPDNCDLDPTDDLLGCGNYDGC